MNIEYDTWHTADESGVAIPTIGDRVQLPVASIGKHVATPHHLPAPRSQLNWHGCDGYRARGHTRRVTIAH
jgi:hypothetical protein